MDSFVQSLSLLSVSDLASGYIRAGVHTRRIGAETIEIHSEIVAGMQRSEALNQLQEWLTRVGSGKVRGQQPLALQAGSQLFLCVASISGRIDRILRIFLHPLDRIQRMRAILRRSSRSRPRRTLRRSLFRTQRQRN